MLYNVVLGLTVLLLMARIVGDLFDKLKIPVLVGNVLAGIIMGPAYLAAISPEGMDIFAQIGAVLLIFSFGCRHIAKKDLFKDRKHVLPMSAAIFLFPFTLAMLFFSYSGVPLGLAFLLAVAVGMPSIGEKQDRRKMIEGTAVLSAGIGIGIASLFFVFQAQDPTNIITSFILFFVSFIISEKLVPFFMRMNKSLDANGAQLLSALILILSVGAIIGLLGIEGYGGAFLAGILLSGLPKAREGFTDKIQELSDDVFAPIFYGWCGLLFNPGLLGSFSLYFIIFALLMKLGVGSFWERKTSAKHRLHLEGIELVVASGILGFSFFLPSLLDNLFSSFLIFVLVLGVAARE